MKKGIIRMVFGAILVGLQLMSVLGSMKAGIPLPSISFAGSLAQIGYDLIFCASYYLVGIIGIALFVFGYVAHFKN